MTEKSIQITDNAAKRIAFLAGQEQKPDVKLRISVDGGGCSGFQYKFGFDHEVHTDDQIFTKGPASVLVDTLSLDYMNGSVLDYVETLGAAHFEIKNPNATANCGCGNSFSV